MIGFELEISLPITDRNGRKLDGETELGPSRTLDFRLVSDKRQGYSNIEFVTGPVSVVGTSGGVNGPKLLHELLAGIKQVRDELYKAGDAKLADAAGGLLNLTSAGSTALLNPSEPKYKDAATLKGGGDGLFLHYSVGVPLGALSAFFELLRKFAPYEPDAFLAHARWRNQQAAELAEEGVKQFAEKFNSAAKTAAAQVHGYLQLVYTQVAAMADYVGRKQDEGQIKNETVALCRSAFHEVFPLLEKDARTFLAAGFADESLIDLIAKHQEVTEVKNVRMQFQERSTRQIDGKAYSLIEYTRSALTGDPVIPQQGIFGKTTQVPPGPEQGTTVIPFEIRTLGTHYKTWDQVSADLITLTKWVQSVS